ncbi:MAG: TIGR00341 family protein, partial [Xanthomonadales bacterium]|nr:TIGR00341 family protein [Xanthomonadales bacterium]
MKYVELISNTGNVDTVAAIAEQHEVIDLRASAPGEDGLQAIRLLVADDKLQSVLDALQSILGSQPNARIVVLPVEITLPKASEEQQEDEDSAVAVRETLYRGVEKNARLDLNFMVLVFLSTVVATIGLIENNVAVVIGAMVIAPLLGPNLAFGLGTALGDLALMRKSALTTVVGIGVAVVLSVAVGLLWPMEIYSPEI